jgi:hypothetical protein
MATTRTTTIRIDHPVDRDDELCVRRDAIRFLTIPEHRFVAVDADGPPLPEAFAARMPALYATAYGLRFGLKRRGIVTKVGPLEGLWSTLTGATQLDAIVAEDRSDWRWTLMIALPDEAEEADIALHVAGARDKVDPQVAASLRIERFDEGPAAQLLHVGPYAEEWPSIARLHAAVHDAGLILRGRHHELYLGDPRRSAPERLRTLLRHPVSPA